MFRSRRPVTRIRPPAFRRGLRLEWLEDRTTPTTLFVDDSLVAGTAVGSLGGRVTLDRGTIGTLDDGDQVTVGLGETGATTTLTFRTGLSTTAAAGDAGVAYQSINAALAAALATSLTDVTVEVAKGTYAESVAFTNPAANSLTQFTIDGLTGTAADVVIDPAAGAGITVDTTAAAVTGGVTLSDLRVTGAADGVVATGIANALTLNNVAVQGNTGVGLNLTGTGAATAALTLDRVTVSGNTTQAADIEGFATVNLTNTSIVTVGGSTQSTIAFPAALANATLNVSATGSTPSIVTATGTTLQISPQGGAAGAVLALSNVDALNLTGGTGIDTFVVTPAATGGPVITVNGGAGSKDVFDAGGSTTGLTATATAGANGFNGTVTSGTTATVNFNNIESFADGSTISGRVFIDADLSGGMNGAETGFAGATVFLDQDGDNAPDAGELTATTAADGSFSFTGLPPGTFQVRIVTPTGTALTTSGTPADVVITTLGATTTPVNFGLDLTVGGTVSGVVFNDTDGDGTKDAGEAALSGVTVYLDIDGDGTKDAGEPSAASAADGAFTLSSTADGSFTLRATAPAGFTLPPTLPTVNLTGGASVTQDLGLRPSVTGGPGGTVTGTVYADLNKNGVQDAGETGIRGVRVFLDLNGDGKLKKGEPSATTNVNGEYTLTWNRNGTFDVRPVLSPGYLRGTGPEEVTLSGGNTVTDVDFAVTTKLPPQATPAQRLAAGFIIGGQASVKVFAPDGEELEDIVVFPGLNIRDVRVAVADVTGDGVDDIIVGTGPGVPAQVVILDGTNLQEIARLTPFESGFTGGVYVTAGDVTGDGINDVIISPDEGGGPRVLVFQGGAPGAAGSFQQVASFFGIEDSNFRGGARVSVADVNGDGIPDLIVAAGFGGGPRVAVFNGNSILSGSLVRLFNDFFVFEEGLRNGAFITAGDLDGDGFAEIIGGGGPGGGPRVLALSGADLMTLPPGQAKKLANFFACDQNNRGGIRVVAKDLDGDGKVEIATGAGRTGGGRFSVFNADLSELFGFDANSDDRGGVFVG